jgi:serine/threonine-protein kinase
MPLVPGCTLREHVLRGPTMREVLAIVASALDGLHAAHGAGLVHLDVKPENVMVTEGQTAKVLDFGIARVAGSTSVTRSGAALGTPRYMSPEQVRAHPVDARADVYAAGVTLFEVLAGYPPFDATEPFAVAHAHVYAPPLPLPDEVPEPLRDVVASALAKDPRARFPDAAAFATAIRAALATVDPRQCVPAPAPPAWRVAETRTMPTPVSEVRRIGAALVEPMRARGAQSSDRLGGP